ncbi:sulfatase [Bythopirellula polymerisocia]|uniref:Arylsulfatase n=1 Tax=Bythopirellula polymerisocia TaxID=2528003 RepID=A0A5C6CBG0_9BACT|nr:sulfatase [Bythopirellula polymerisocia]TWU20754.1 Arylsulfatase [Bythopirellula polymerisocia]
MKHPLMILGTVFWVLMVVGLLPPGIADCDTRLPNIVLIYADDMGWKGPSCYGNTYHETPHIDQICSEGMKFTAAYSGGPVCAPSRACLMTGQYVTRHGIYRVNQVEKKHQDVRLTIPPRNVTDLPLDISTIADQLQRAGYVTGYCGKWHLGDKMEHLPSARGFSEALVTRSPSGAKRYFFPDFSTVPPTSIDEGTYLTEVITRWATNFIQEHEKDPFFLYLPHFNVHGPHEASPERIEAFRKKDPTKTKEEATFAAMHAHLDDSVGEVLDKLREMKLDDNTVVIFTSDNGCLKRFSDGTLRGGKGMLYEGGIRVPMIVRWPGKVPRGSLCDQPVHQIDLYPTLLAIAGIVGKPDQECDGVNLLPLLTSNEPYELGRDSLYWHFPTYLKYNEKLNSYDITPCSAIRAGDWKLIEYFTPELPIKSRVQLFNFVDDLGESTNLARKCPEITQQLLEQLHEWRAATGAMMPTLQ